jgi:radical SAM protein with 4Fe4S-binding SPASM domain
LKPELGAGISLDGIGAVHDKVRGTRNAFGKVIRTIRALKSEGIINIRVSYTATSDNVSDLVKVYELSRSLGVEFASVLAHNSEHYFHTETNELVDGPLLRQAYSIVNARELSSASLKRWFRAYYNSGIVLFNEERRRLVPCSAASDFFFLSPRGDVYPCLVLTQKLGNLSEQSFDELWAGARAEEIRHQVESCEQCWMMCSARTMLKKRPWTAAAWVAKEQLARYASALKRAPSPRGDSG